MKKAIHTLLGLLIAVSPVLAQTNAITKYFSVYEAEEDITTISFSGKAFEMMQDVDTDDPDAKKALELASQVEGLKIIIDGEHPNARSSAKAAHKTVENAFEDLVTISEKNNLVYVMVDEANGIVNEVLVIVGGESDFILASVTGKMKLSDVGALTQTLSTAGSEMFANTTVKPNSINVYPNPAKEGNSVKIDLPSNFDGGTVRIYDASGKEVKSFKSSGGLKKLDTSELGKGVFVLKAQNGDLETTRKFVVQ